MEILLVQPNERAILGKPKIRGSVMPPLGLLSLASVIRKNCPNTAVNIIDFEVENDNSYFDFKKYDIVGISGTTVHMPHAVSLIKQVRKDNKDVCILMGGAHATFCHKELLETIPELDAVFRGEGEISFVEFINKYNGRASLPIMDGVSTREKLSAHLSPIVENLDLLPDPAYDLVDLSRYKLSTHRSSLPLPFASIITSRGCPFQCSYCQTPKMFGKNMRFRSPKRVANEIKGLKEQYGVRSIVFWDDTFTSNKNHVVELCNEIQSLNLKWMCNTRVECVSPEILHEMKNSGCSIIFFGVESSFKDTLLSMDRNFDIDVIENAFRWTKEIGIQTVATLMVGAPGDDFKRIEANVDFLKSLKPDYVYISIYNVTPGTTEYSRAQDMGIISSNIDWSNPNQFYGPPFGLPTVNQKLNRYQLQKAQIYAYKQFYGQGREYQYE